MKLISLVFYRFLIITFYSVQLSNAANILFYMGTSSLGHRVAIWPLVTDLIDHGHSVTFLSVHSGQVVKHPKVTEIAIKSALQEIPSIQFLYKNPFKLRQENLHQVYWDLVPIDRLLVCEALLKDKKTNDWVRESKYDLVILDSFHNDCGMGLSHIFGAKLIILASASLFMWQSDAFGFPAETSYIPDMQRSFPQDMTFFQRFRNTIRAIRWHIFREAYLFPQHDELFKQYLKEVNLPPMRDIEKRTSLILLNSHFSHEFARSLPPFVVPIGGLHISENSKPLPKDISKFIGEKEFLYVSFGSNFNLSSLDPQIKDLLITTLGQLSVLVVMKIDEEETLDMPSNILAKHWLPQQDLLAHSKIRGFLSSGGSYSSQEAIYYGIPILVLPIFGKQDYNAEIINREGLGIRLEITVLTLEKLQKALDELLYNKTIHEKVKVASEKFKDRPIRPSNLTLWWIDYVFRHAETDSLKPLSIHQTWIQRRNLDVWLLIFMVVLTSALVVLLFFAFTIYSLVNTIRTDLALRTVEKVNKAQ